MGEGQGMGGKDFRSPFLRLAGGRFRGKATLFLRPDEEALKKVKFKGGDPG